MKKEKPKIKTSKKGIIAESFVSKRKYRVFKWKEFEDGRIIALKKEEITENG